MTSLVKYSNLFKQIVRPTYRSSSLSYSDKAKKNEVAIEDEIYSDDKPVDLKLFIINEDDTEAREKVIQQNRNKSKLLDAHRRKLNNQVPYDEPQSWVHNTLEYKRKMYGRYGAASGVDPRLLFPTLDERQDLQEYERVAYPHTLEEMVAISKQEKEEKLAAIRKREDDIDKKMNKSAQWIIELNAKVTKKEAEAEQIKAKKERAIEEIRRQIGYRLNPRDPRLKELMDQKEEDEKKAKKIAKKKLKEEKVLKMLQQKSQQLLKDADDKHSPEKTKNETGEEDKGSGN